MEKSLLKGFTIKLPDCRELVASLDEEEALELISLARVHSKKGKKADEKRLTSKMVGYIKYLEQNKDKLQGEELEHYGILSKWLL